MSDDLQIIRQHVIDVLPDTTPKPVPSTTSDKPVIEAEAKPAESAPVGETGEAEPVVLSDEEKIEELAKKLEDGDLPDDMSVGYKRALTRLRNRRKTAEASLAAAQEQTRQALAIAEHARRFIPNEQERPEPQIQDYDVSTDQGIRTYVAHQSEWLADQKDKARQQERAQRTQAEAAQKVQGTYMERLQDAEERFPGIMDVGTGKDQSVPINEAMAAAIMLSDKAPEVLDYLRGHKDEAKAIYNQPPARAAAMVGKIEAQLAQPKAPLVSKMPKAITPVGGGNEVPVDVNDPKLSSADYWRIKDAQEAEKVKALKEGRPTRH